MALLWLDSYPEDLPGQAGIARDKAHPHALKHSCATHMVKLTNGNVVWIQDHLGHADVRSTMRYIPRG